MQWAIYKKPPKALKPIFIVIVLARDANEALYKFISERGVSRSEAKQLFALPSNARR